MSLMSLMSGCMHGICTDITVCFPVSKSGPQSRYLPIIARL